MAPDRPAAVLSGLDTVECAYFLDGGSTGQFPFDSLLLQKEAIQRSKKREPTRVDVGGVEFLIGGYGSSSGYPLVLSNPDMTVCCGELNSPSFFVKYSSHALWHKGLRVLHNEFIALADRLGLKARKVESLSRVDLTFDFHLPCVDFDDDNVVSLSAKSAVHRNERTLQGVQFGKGDVVLRLYDKVAEIEEKSRKTWFYDLWGRKQDVWRIEWQVRKDVLRRFGVRTLDDLDAHQGDLLRYLADEHDSLRVRTHDTNRSRWPLHPLWVELREQIATFDMTGLYRDVNDTGLLQERLTRIATSVYGYAKQAAAIHRLLTGRERATLDHSLDELRLIMGELHDVHSWNVDVNKRIDKLRLGAI